jgi:hypothetical protein
MSHRQGVQAAYIVLERRIGKSGRPKILTDRQINIAQSLYTDKKTSIPEMCQTLKIPRATLYRALKSEEKDRQSSPLT